MRLEANGTLRTCERCGTSFVLRTAPDGMCPRCLLASVRPLPPSEGARERPSRPAHHAWPEIPGYEILAKVGAGGSGTVYRARTLTDEFDDDVGAELNDEDLIVALKVLPTGDDARARRFMREVQALHQLDHPGIVSVLEAGLDEDRLWVAMEYVEGLDLRRLLRTGPLSETQALRFTRELCEALEAAHAKGIVHRDIKPENVLLDRAGSVKLADFGLVRLKSSAEQRLTGSETALGTPVYMAPEQIESPQDVDERADVFALGVLLYELTTGELPLGRFDPPSRRAPIDPRLDAVVMRALDKRPERRFPSVLALRQALDRALETADPVQGAGRRLRRLRTERRRARPVPILVGLAVLLLVGVLFARLEPFALPLFAFELAVATWTMVAVASPQVQASRWSPRATLAFSIPILVSLGQIVAPAEMLVWAGSWLGLVEPTAEAIHAVWSAGALCAGACLIALVSARL